MTKLSEEDKQKFDAVLASIQTPRQALDFVTRVCEHAGSGGEYEPYHWFGIMFRLREIQRQADAAMRGRQVSTPEAPRTPVPPIDDSEAEQVEGGEAQQGQTVQSPVRQRPMPNRVPPRQV